jgi:hypothetical protein
MRKTSKLISFLCSITVAATSFVGVISANAETVTDGLELVYNKDASTSTTANLDVYVKGYSSLSAYTVELVAEGATISTIEYTVKTVGFTASDNTTANAEGKVNFSGYISGDDEVPVTEDTPLANVTITFTEPLTSDAVVKLAPKSVTDSLEENKKLEVSEGTMGDSAVTVLADPQATEAPTPETTEAPTPTPTPIVNVRPTLKPVATVDPDAPTAEPEATPIVITDGLELVYNKDASTSTTANLDVYVKGYSSLSAYTVELVAEGATISTIEYTVKTAGFTASDNTTANAEGKVNFSGYISGDDEVPVTEDTPLANVTVTFTEPLTADAVIKLAPKSVTDSLEENKKLEVSGGTMTVSAVTVLADPTATEAPEATEAPTKAPLTGDATIAVKDLVGTPETTVDGNKLAGVYIDVTKEDGTPVYGTDYQAFLGDTPLTEEEFAFVKAGYTADGTAEVSDVQADVIDKLVIKAVNGVTVTAGPAYATADGNLTTPADTVNSETVAPAATDEPTATPAATATATPAAGGSSGGGSGSGNGSSSNNGTTSGGHSSSTIASSATGSTSVNGGVVTTTVNFQDLSSVPWAEDAIKSLASLGVINGRSETIFDPNATVTRAEFAKMVCNAFGITTNTNNTQTFTDVTVSDWFYQSVEAAAAAGVINGISDTEFAPNELVTREQMAAMLYRAVAYKGISLKTGSPVSFTDASSISEYAVTAVNALSSAGVINGMDDGSFAPKESATRAQAACIIYQYFASFAG